MSIQSEARDYAYLRPRLKYDDIVADAKKKFATEADRKVFVDAVLGANIRIENERERRNKAARFV
jgi:hypothetical protein